MHHHIGLDIGGTKIAGGVFTKDGEVLDEHVVPTPDNYQAFLAACRDVVQRFDKKCGGCGTVGVGVPGRIDHQSGKIIVSANLAFLKGKPFRPELESLLGREIRLANDANCMALGEAVDGAGEGYAAVLGLILGTGVGGGFVYQGRILDGPNGLTGEIGHLPLPFREEADGPVVKCECGQEGCIEKSICGGACARLYAFMTGKQVDAKTIADRARGNDAEALRVLDHYFETVAKAMVAILHTFDPDVIVVSGGLNALPGLYEEVPKRWGKYAYASQLKTKFLPARHGPASGLRGAAWLWREVVGASG